jgi:hypothetical protein
VRILWVVGHAATEAEVGRVVDAIRALAAGRSR